MANGRHLQPGFLLRTQLLPDVKRAAQAEGVSVSAWIVSAISDRLRKAESTHDVRLPIGTTDQAVAVASQVSSSSSDNTIRRSSGN